MRIVLKTHTVLPTPLEIIVFNRCQEEISNLDTLNAPKGELQYVKWLRKIKSSNIKYFFIVNYVESSEGRMLNVELSTLNIFYDSTFHARLQYFTVTLLYCTQIVLFRRLHFESKNCDID